MTEKIRLQYLSGNAPVGAVVRNGNAIVQNIILREKGDEVEITLYPGVMVLVGELVSNDVVEPNNDNTDTEYEEIKDGNG